MENNNYSQEVTVFHNRVTPEPGELVGYAAIIEHYQLKVPIPFNLSLISQKHKRYALENWKVFTPRHKPESSLSGHLTFALKYEGIDLLVLKKLFSKLNSEEIEHIVGYDSTSQYSRKIWFLYEWLTDKKLTFPDLKKGNYVDLLDDSLQYSGPSINSPRHRVRNNLPGVKEFCPLISKTNLLKEYQEKELDKMVDKSLSPIRKDILMRASAFLLLKDSKASYAIEGESPPQNRMQRWGKAIGQAGTKELSKEEFLRLQKIVIENDRFITMGWRKEEGFVGEHDREFGTPVPDHISAKWQDIGSLMDGLIKTNQKLQNSDFDPVLAATIIAFGFVLIHPFADGNGRIHRYLIHHVLAKMGFTKHNLIFPVAAAILGRIHDYRKVLEDYSLQRLELIDWKPTNNNNVEVLNDTIDLYRYFDATQMAEFLYSCVQETIDKIIPEEVDYLQKYDLFKQTIDQQFDMPDKLIALLVRFLEQGEGKLSKRAREIEFNMLANEETLLIENIFHEIFSKEI
ncbi:MAG: Fic family protein [Bacteroidales bacterium]|nr:Fic family protein [Bacteroidales bacterium]